MGSFVPSTPSQRQAMLEAVGVPSYEGLYESVPHSLLLKE